MRASLPICESALNGVEAVEVSKVKEIIRQYELVILELKNDILKQ